MRGSFKRFDGGIKVGCGVKKTIIIIAILAVVGGIIGAVWQMMPHEREASEIGHDSINGVISPALALDSLYKQVERDMKAELDYYLERHNVEDEGYEMVAAFAAGKRHSETIDTIAITNIGSWKGKKREGTAITRDSLGRLTIGHWDNDTLTSGIITSTLLCLLTIPLVAHFFPQ